LLMTRGNTAPAYQPSHYQAQPVRVAKQRRVRRIRVRPIPLYGMAVSFVVLLAVLYLSQYAVLAHMNHQVYCLQRELDTLARVNSDLKREMARLSSLERIEEVAVGELGMVPAAEVRYIVLEQVDSQEYPLKAEDGIVTENGIFAFLGRLLPKAGSAYAQSPEKR
jgi:cell division protein FtsL